MRFERSTDSDAILKVVAFPETPEEERALCEAPWIPGEGLADRRGRHLVDCPHVTTPRNSTGASPEGDDG